MVYVLGHTRRSPCRTEGPGYSVVNFLILVFRGLVHVQLGDLVVADEDGDLQVSRGKEYPCGGPHFLDTELRCERS